MKVLIQALWVLFLSLLTGCESSVVFDVLNPPGTPEGYLMISGDDVAYKMYNDELSWGDSRARCISDGGDLAMADTSNKIRKINYMNGGSGAWSWVGFRRHSISKEWLRVDNGLPVTSLPWKFYAFRYPKYDCATIVNAFQLIDIPCTSKRKSVCEINYATNKVNDTKGNPPKGMHPPGTPEGYLMLPGENVAYKMYNDKLSWDESRARCISDGGDLAIADTSDKIHNIKYLNSGSGTWSWVGFRRHSISEEWLRVDNGLPAKSLPWITPPEAFLQLDYDCAAITYGSKITDLACRWAQTSICEIEINGARNISTNTTSVLPDFVYPSDNIAYEIYKDNMTWDEARDRCISNGGDLAVIYTGEQIQQLESNVSSSVIDSLHIGIHKPRGILDWISVNDDMEVSSIAWAKPYPALKYSKRSCALLSSDQHAILNIDCDNRKAGSICEFPIGGEQLSISNTSPHLHQKKKLKNVLNLLCVLIYLVYLT